MGHKLIKTLTQIFGRGILIRIEGNSLRRTGSDLVCRYLQTPGVRDSLRQPRQVPKFSSVTRWEQYRQVFGAIVLSNGWDDATAALQLLSHLEGNALKVALLVPSPRRASRVGLVGALSAHYGAPGPLADYTNVRGGPVHFRHSIGDIGNKRLLATWARRHGFGLFEIDL